MNGVAGEELDEGQVSSLLSSGKNVEALQLLLRHPPLATKDQSAKDRAFALVAKVMMSFKGTYKNKKDSSKVYTYSGLNPEDGCPVSPSAVYSYSFEF